MKARQRRLPPDAFVATIHELFDEAANLYDGDIGRWEVALDGNVWANFEWLLRDAGPNEANLRSAPSSTLLIVRPAVDDRSRFVYDTH